MTYFLISLPRYYRPDRRQSDSNYLQCWDICRVDFSLAYKKLDKVLSSIAVCILLTGRVAHCCVGISRHTQLTQETLPVSGACIL